MGDRRNKKRGRKEEQRELSTQYHNSLQDSFSSKDSILSIL